MIWAIIGKIAIWLIGLVASFYVPAGLVMAFKRGGLEVFSLALWAGGTCFALYVAGSMIYFAVT